MSVAKWTIFQAAPCNDPSDVTDDSGTHPVHHVAGTASRMILVTHYRHTIPGLVSGLCQLPRFENVVSQWF
jgi:hypothetical protein